MALFASDDPGVDVPSTTMRCASAKGDQGGTSLLRGRGAGLKEQNGARSKTGEQDMFGMFCSFNILKLPNNKRHIICEWNECLLC